jgi:hypothetical protein
MLWTEPGYARILRAGVVSLQMLWTEPGYARILRAGVVSLQMLMSGHIVKTRNPNPGRQKNGGQKNEDLTRFGRLQIG